jgi:hypothetical protein
VFAEAKDGQLPCWTLIDDADAEIPARPPATEGETSDPGPAIESSDSAVTAGALAPEDVPLAEDVIAFRDLFEAGRALCAVQADRDFRITPVQPFGWRLGNDLRFVKWKALVLHVLGTAFPALDESINAGKLNAVATVFMRDHGPAIKPWVLTSEELRTWAREAKP